MDFWSVRPFAHLKRYRWQRWADLEHWRLEAMRYFDLLAGHRRQVEMIDAFLRQPWQEQTAVDFKGVPTADYSIAIIAGLNWLDHCASTARADCSKFQPYPAQFQ
jgi:hypothetical protein